MRSAPLDLLACAAALLTSFSHALILLEGGTVITFNSTTNYLEVLRGSSVLIQNDIVIEISESFNSSIMQSAEIVNCTSKIVSPGFIDTHHHVWQSAMKTVASNSTFTEYFLRYGEYSAWAFYTPEDVYYGELTGLLESLNAGVTTVVDFAHHTWSPEHSLAGLQGAVDSNARVVWSYSVHNLSSVGLNFTVADQYSDLQSLAQNRSIWENSNTRIGYATDRFAIASPDEIRSAMKLATDNNLTLITTHAAGTPYIADTTPTTLQNYNILNGSIPVIMAHGYDLTQSDALLLRQYDQYLSITPESEMQFGAGHPNTDKILDQASLGIDCHVLFSADIVSQARLWLQTVRLRRMNIVNNDWKAASYQPMSVNQAFLLATQHGGLALHRTDLGVIQVGAKADIAIFSTDSPGLLGWNDPVAAIILHSNVGDVQHVLVNGEFVKKDFQLVDPQYAEIKANFLVGAKKIQDHLKATPYPVLKGGWPFVPGVQLESPEIVDAQRGNGTGLGSLFVI